MRENPQAWYKQEVFKRPQQSTGNQVLDNIIQATQPQSRPQTFSDTIRNRPLMAENPNNISMQHRQAHARQALDEQYYQAKMANLPQQGEYYLSSGNQLRQPQVPLADNQAANNPIYNNPNMKAGFTTLALPQNIALGGGGGLIGAGIDSDNRARGFALGATSAIALRHGLPKAYKEINTRLPLRDTQNALQNRYATLSYETRMSENIPNLQKEYQMLGDRVTANKFDKAVNSEQGVKDLLISLGLKHKDTGIKDGWYNGISNPSRQVQIEAEFDKNGNLTKEFIDKMNYASAVIGKNFKQDSVGWHVPNTKAMPNETNGLSINLGKSVNAYELKKLDEALNPIINGEKINKYGFIPDPDGKSVRIIDFDTYGKDFTNTSSDIKNSLKQAGYNTNEAIPFGIKGGLVDGNNWQYDTYGYERKIGEYDRSIFGRSDNRFDEPIARIYNGQKRARQADIRLGDIYQRRLLEATENAKRKGNAPSNGKSQSNARLEADANGFTKKGFITPGLASHIATSVKRHLLLPQCVK